MKKVHKAIIYCALLALGATAGYAAEKYPHIRTALRELEGAKIELQNASTDFAGHRVLALQSVDEAQRQLNLARNSAPR